MNHWAAKYLTERWTPENNCWTLCEKVQQAEFGRACPTYDLCNPKDTLLVASKMKAAIDSPKWIRLDKPAEGCIVALGRSRKVVHHVGIYTASDGGLVLHLSEVNKVAQLQPLNALPALGWGLVQFYAHRTWLTSS